MMSRVSAIAETLLTVSLLKGVGAASLRKARDLCADSQCSVDELAEAIPTIRRTISDPNALEVAREKARSQIEIAEANQCHIICSLDDTYPLLARESIFDPVVLYVRGELSALVSETIALVGTREPTQHAETIAQRIADFFSGSSYVVLSGLANGCDAIAHKAALNSSGKTVAVLAHGLQTIAPKQNIELAEQMIESGGALVSQFPYGTQPRPQLFAARDQIQAALSAGVVMIQSKTTGGSLHACRASVSLGRPVWVPAATEFDRRSHPEQAGANLLLEAGTEAEISMLLSCNASQTKLLSILRSSEDYPSMLKRLSEVQLNMGAPQTNLF